jgi:hypothetical protein
MEFGVGTFPGNEGIRPDSLARLAEERGHESLFFPEHTHMPAEHTSLGDAPVAFPEHTHTPAEHTPLEDVLLARHHAHSFDLFVAVTAAVTATMRLRGRCWTFGLTLLGCCARECPRNALPRDRSRDAFAGFRLDYRDDGVEVDEQVTGAARFRVGPVRGRVGDQPGVF